MREAYELAREHLGVSAQRAKRYYDLRVRPNKYSVGQWVFYYYPRRYVGRSPKWQKLYTGPYLVTQVMGPVNVKIQLSRRAQPFIVHVDKLKLCLGETPNSWLSEPPEEGQSPAGFELQTEEDVRETLPKVLEESENELDEERIEDVNSPNDTAPEVEGILMPESEVLVEEEGLPQRPSREKRRPQKLTGYVCCAQP